MKICVRALSKLNSLIYPGRHIYNVRDKSNTFTVEGVNSDLRHYITILARRSRCFSRKPDAWQAVIDVFVEAYNRFGKAKQNWRTAHDKGESPFALVDFLQSAQLATPKIRTVLIFLRNSARMKYGSI